mgnify:CR=1 FL=1
MTVCQILSRIKLSIKNFRTLNVFGTFVLIVYINLLFGIHFSTLIVTQSNVGCLVHSTKPPTLGHIITTVGGLDTALITLKNSFDLMS